MVTLHRHIAGRILQSGRARWGKCPEVTPRASGPHNGPVLEGQPERTTVTVTDSAGSPDPAAATDTVTGTGLVQLAYHEAEYALMPERSPTVLPLYVSAAEAANMLALSRSEVYRLLDAGVIASVRHGARRLVILESVHEFADSLAQEA